MADEQSSTTWTSCSDLTSRVNLYTFSPSCIVYVLLYCSRTSIWVTLTSLVIFSSTCSRTRGLLSWPLYMTVCLKHCSAQCTVHTPPLMSWCVNSVKIIYNVCSCFVVYKPSSLKMFTCWKWGDIFLCMCVVVRAWKKILKKRYALLPERKYWHVVDRRGGTSLFAGFCHCFASNVQKKSCFKEDLEKGSTPVCYGALQPHFKKLHLTFFDFWKIT